MFTFEKIEQLLGATRDVSNKSYVKAYSHFIKFFEDLDVIDQQSFVIGAHFAYGWMPTMVTLREQSNEFQDEIALLNRARNGEMLDADELYILRKSVNNSMVGASKLLHFINPHQYAIWDSRVNRCWTGGKPQYRIKWPSQYLRYLNNCKDITSNPEFKQINETVNTHMDDEVTPLRAIEWIAFCAGRNKE